MRIEARTERLEVFGADVADSVFDDVAMMRTRVEHANLSGIRFFDVDASGATFEDVNLSGARFRNAKLAGVSIEESCVSGMTINGVLVTDLLDIYEAAKRAGGD